jgi:hypothetical protein
VRSNPPRKSRIGIVSPVENTLISTGHGELGMFRERYIEAHGLVRKEGGGMLKKPTSDRSTVHDLKLGDRFRLIVLVRYRTGCLAPYYR